MRKLTGLLVMLLLAACGRIGLGSNENDVVIEFDNESTEQATLYVVMIGGVCLLTAAAFVALVDDVGLPPPV